ncbi:MAG: hypothetical protein MUD11_02480 [Rhodobacteraceae bacterium]|nr:hypothetical protein [Paracoccaceae bacterium]
MGGAARPAAAPVAVRPAAAPVSQPEPRRDDCRRDGRGRNQYDDDDDYRYKKKRKESFLGDLFDF